MAPSLASLTFFGLRYNSPMTQIVLLGLVVFCTVGMFSAVSNLGAGGTQSIALSDTANGVLYGTFALGGMVAGGVTNLLGARMTLTIGSLGYALYIGSLWCHQTTGNGWFLILAGAILGLCAALLWAAQGSLMMALPSEKEKGRAFAVFWTIFNCGTLLGGIIALALTVRDGKVAALSNKIYVAFLIIMLIGTCITWLILPVSKVIRPDGSIVQLEQQATVGQELKGMWQAIKMWQMLALLPMFWSSNFFYAYQGAVNTNRFDGRTRALVGVLNGLGAIIGAIVIGLVTDLMPARRRVRGYVGVGVVLALAIAIWGGGLAFQLKFTRADPSPVWDYTDGAAVGPIILLGSYYVVDAAFQGLAYWVMGALSNDPRKLARFAGLYKAVQSAGAAASFGIDAVATPYLSEFLASAILVLISLPLAAFVISRLPDHTSDVEGLVKVEDVGSLNSDVAIPEGHHLGGTEAGHHVITPVSEKDEIKMSS